MTPRDPNQGHTQRETPREPECELKPPSAHCVRGYVLVITKLDRLARSHGAGPQSLKELQPIRPDFERAQEGLQSLRFKLASALFSGIPRGAKQVLEP